MFWFDFCFNFVYMIGLLIIIGGFILFGYIGRKIALFIFDLLFTGSRQTTTFIDNSVHHHYHEHKNLTIIDDETREQILNNKN